MDDICQEGVRVIGRNTRENKVRELEIRQMRKCYLESGDKNTNNKRHLSQGVQGLPGWLRSLCAADSNEED